MIGNFVAAVEVSEIKSQAGLRLGLRRRHGGSAGPGTGARADRDRGQPPAAAEAFRLHGTFRSPPRTWPISVATPAMLMRAFGYNNTDANTLSGACGAGATIRQTMAQEQATVAREAGSVETRQVYAPGRPTLSCPGHACSDRAAAQPQLSSPDLKRIEYERQNQQDWERRLGPVRVRTIKAALPEGSAEDRLSDRA